MKYSLFLLCYSFTTSFLFAQTAAEFYKKGDSLYVAKDYKNSAIAYTEGIRIEGKAATADKYWDLASIWAMDNNADSAFAYLTILATTKDLSFSDFVTVISYIPAFASIKNDSRWVELKNKMFANARKTFLSTLQKQGNNIPISDRHYAADAWALLNNSDSAFAQIQIIADRKSIPFSAYTNLKNDQDLSSLRGDKRWQPLLEKIYKKAETTFLTPEDSSYTKNEIIYGRKDGMALTMFHLKPQTNSNGKVIIQVISGSWRSNALNLNDVSVKPFLKKGYTVFVVVHGSAPVYTIIDAVADLQRAVRFIRFNAADYQVEPNKIGITGASAGGHLSLICGLMDKSVGENSGDPIDFISAKVQAVACYYPPTDFLNWGAAGQNIMKSDLMKAPVFNHLFEIRKWNPQRRLFSYITDTIETNKILFDISPINNISSNDAPVLIIHGDQDNVVPLQQSESLIKKLQEAKVPASLNIKKGGRHGWERDDSEIQMFIGWFDKYLK